VRLGSNIIGEPGNVLLRRDQVRRIGKFDGTYGYVIDLDYWFRALQLGDAYYLPVLLSTFRISADSWSVAIGRRQYHEFRDFARKYSRDPAYRLGRIDLAMAMLMAYVNAQARRLAYWWLLPKRAGPTGGSARAGQVGETTRTRR
jgi:GT2 family glycosyltransferase